MIFILQACKMPKFKPNAYGEFVSEFRKTKAKEGINYPSFDAAAKDANSLWQVIHLITCMSICQLIFNIGTKCRLLLFWLC